MVIAFDLDDTLFKEIDFVRSAYREIARIHGAHLLPGMLNAASPREAFDSTGRPIEELLEIYRYHKPTIRLPWQSLYTLASLKNTGHELAIITDGRSLTQRNKIEALGLGRFVAPEMILISGEIGAEKLSGEPFRILMERRPEERFVYVGDNPAKDFEAANKLGWETIALNNNGENIHPQNFESVPLPMRPHLRVDSLTEMLKIVNLE